MITAHLPSGYVLARSAKWSGAVMAAALVGAVWPDLDLLFFYFVDNRAFHHHRYWVHVPAFALGVSAVLWAFAGRFRPLALAFGAGWCLHILLDAPVGGIMWLWPLSDRLMVLVEVPPTQPHWVASFILHWSFAAELAVWAMAVSFWRRRAHAP